MQGNRTKVCANDRDNVSCFSDTTEVWQWFVLWTGALCVGLLILQLIFQLRHSPDVEGALFGVVWLSQGLSSQ